jgi:hypothetical protein
MTDHRTKSFAKKHGAEIRPDDAVKQEIRSRAKADQLPCATAFDIAKKLNVNPDVVGRNADLLNFRLIKCQMGLFGYPAGKTVAPLAGADPDLANAIRAGVENGSLACRTAWALAARFDIPRRAVANACEALKIKIKPCQLGAF